LIYIVTEAAFKIILNSPGQTSTEQ